MARSLFSGLSFLLLWLQVHVLHVEGGGGRWEIVRLALQTLRKLDVIDVNTLPYNWRVPDDTSWPLETRGVRLGEILSRIKKRGDFVKKHAQELEELGVKTTMSKNDLEFEHFIDALHSYKLEHGHSKVPARFIAASGYKLGQKSESIRRQDLFNQPSQRARLTKIGFFFGPKRRIQSDETVLLALQHYKKTYNDLHVPFHFVIPHNQTPPWPKEVEGIKLGHVVSRIRNRGSYKHLRSQLDDLDFPWIVWKDAKFVSLLEQLSQLEFSRLERKYSRSSFDDDNKSV